MADITYDRLSVSGVAYLSIEGLEIIQKVNEHAKARVSLVVEDEVGRDFMDHTFEGQAVAVYVDGSPVYCGLIQQAAVNYEKTYALLNLELISCSILWDIQKRNKSYQQIGTGYAALMEEAAAGTGTVINHAAAMASESMVVQYQETVWQFMRRMAAYMKAPLFVDPTGTAPVLNIGASGSLSGGRATEAGSAGGSGVSGQIVKLGSVSGGLCVSEVRSVIQKGCLKTSYSLAAPSSLIPLYSRPAYIGKIFSGVVQAVRQTDIQVWIPELDPSYEGGNTWFPYSTAYSSEVNEAGIYCMPVEGDPVRVFLPSEMLKDLFASSGPSVRGVREDKEERCFETPDGMRVLFGRDGLTINVRDSTSFIQLNKDGYIAIASNKSIGIVSKSNVKLEAIDGKIDMQAANSLEMITPGSYLGLSYQDGHGCINLFSKQIYIGQPSE